MKLHLHFHDAFEEAQHPRAKGGEFTSKGQGESGSTTEQSTKEDHGDLIGNHEHRQNFADKIVQKHGMKPVKVEQEAGGKGYWLARAGRNNIYTNSDEWSKETFDRTTKELDGIVVDTSPEGTLTHELGHAAFAQINERHNKRAEALAQKYYDMSNGTGLYPPSPYGQEDPHEWAAEAFLAINVGHIAEIGPKEQQEKGFAHAKEFWDEMFKLRDEPEDPPPKPIRFRKGRGE